MAKIEDARPLRVLDALGGWTVEVRVSLDDGSEGAASVPSGVSVGRYEAKTVTAERAVDNIAGVVKRKILGLDAGDQRGLDRILVELDGTEDKSNLGANTLLAVSEAVCCAAAASLKMPLYRYIDALFEPETINFSLPTPMFNVIEGGLHTHNDLDFQEFLFVPLGKESFLEKVELGAHFYRELKNALLEMGLAVAVGDEGGFSPLGIDNVQALTILRKAADRLNLKDAEQIGLGVDVAAGQFKQGGLYRFKTGSQTAGSSEMVSRLISLAAEFNLVYLEDPLSEDDRGWKDLKNRLPKRTEVIGDDLTVTNPKRLVEIIPQRIIHGVIIKPNQIGTLSETITAVEIAKKAGLSLVVSHRAGETESSFIADFAVAIGAKYVKFGAPARGERVAKYDRLLEIEAEIMPRINH